MHKTKNNRNLENIENLSKEELIGLVKLLAKNQFALDGVWFQSIESKYGMDEAMEHDRNVWRRYTEIDARRIKSFLKLPDNAGIDGLEKALSLRFCALSNSSEIIVKEDALIYRVIDCRVQTARSRKNMPLHPCKSVGIIEYTYFAKVIDPRFRCEMVSCYPDVRDNTCACAWKFTLQEDSK